MNGDHIRRGAVYLRPNGWRKAFLFGAACCLAMMAWGCGKGATDPAVQSTGTGGSQTSVQLAVSVSSVSFGSATVNTAVTQSLTLTSTGTAAVTINSAAMTGAGFTIVAQTFPVTLNPGQSLTIQLQFAPTAAGAITGQLTISSNSTTGGTSLVALSGTGTSASGPQASPVLTVGAANVNFGSTVVNTAVTQSLTLTSTGTSPVTINSGTIAGTGFAILGGSFPVTLNPSQTLTLQLQFDPTTAGALSGQLTISSNSTTGSTAVVGLSGTGAAAAHNVALNWNAPVSSADPVAGYNIYRATGGGSFVLINSSPDANVAYTDSGVTSGVGYSYQVTSVDFSGVESVPSNQIAVTIP
jgi:hypothetical protein